MSNLYKKINITAKKTDKYLKKFFLNKNKYNSNLIKPMKYGVFSGGKRFRSSILINTGKIFGINYNNLIIIGSAVECIHSYSLIHDDLPSMDNDDLRRGKLSTHKKYGESTAVLAGNSLLIMAIVSISDLFPSRHLVRFAEVFSGDPSSSPSSASVFERTDASYQSLR